ncbi:unnamed protein product [Nippostrongylus brasiliensis]|uniref:Col_cuticle_N domain-containing protein n=1 Tax=Nippostrongylus brasiliensis TaxID=27835 RepID=A0A0N4YD41_NIPBR|nr:unnamed protein product [Nippostrongylus brasiliensis]
MYSDSSDEKKLWHEAEGLRRIAFFGICISTVATLTAIVAIPSLYNYMQHVQSSLQTEVDFCKHRTDGLFTQYERMQRIKGVRGGIVKRQAGYDAPAEYNADAAVQSDAASQHGDAGSDGAPGNPGAPGEQGPLGETGAGGGCDHCPPPRTAPGY